MFKDAPKLKKPAPCYIPESGAAHFLSLLKKHGIPFKFTHYEDIEDKSELPDFFVPPAELNIKVTRLSMVETNIDPDFLVEKFYEMLESEEYQSIKNKESIEAKEDDGNFKQPGIWVARPES